ncbi:hypothetical protein ACFX19_025816 [Malus domestica]
MASSASENRLGLSKIVTNGKHGENSPYFDKCFPLIWWKSGLGDIPRPLFALLKELRSSEAWPISKTTMASQSSDRPLLRSCRKHEVVESYLILTEAKPPEQTSWSCSV